MLALGGMAPIRFAKSRTSTIPSPEQSVFVFILFRIDQSGQPIIEKRNRNANKTEYEIFYTGVSGCFGNFWKARKSHTAIYVDGIDIRSINVSLSTADMISP
jgi:hypothetical protein